MGSDFDMKQSGLQILFEHEADQEIGRLDASWCQRATFAFVADKSGVETAWIRQALEQLPDPYREDHFALLTSGSTGQPKLVVGNRRRAERLAGVLHEAQTSETIVALPLTYCYAFVNQWLWARQHDRRVVLTRGLARPDRLRAVLRDASDAMLCLVGAQAPIFLNHFAGEAFPGVIRIHFAGGRFPQGQISELQIMFPNSVIYNNYGCAQAMPRLAMRLANDSDDPHHIGWPLPGIELRVSQLGELSFRSPYAAVAHVDEFGLSRIDEETWVETGDLGHQADDGHWELPGRKGEIFKRYGERVSPSHVLDGVTSEWSGQATFYLALDRSNEQGYVVVLAPEPDPSQINAVLRLLRRNFPRPQWPLRIERLPELPLLPNRKVDPETLSAHANKKSHWENRL